MRTRAGLAIICAGLALAPAAALAQAQQHPMVEAAATRIVQKYQSSSCQQLAAERQAPKTAEKEAAIKKVGELMRQDAQVRHEFVSKAAAPIVDKMIVCGFIP
ncbi:MAG TPA: hypothetical protein VJS38_08480 [Phenylobacterium sp.]|uniref:hypothetical protein n=1 Tax=Phenylobacterium sp. TaxID=1871053 RepID=UPI002B45FA6D|nr:hypothetical protein [Phenylobacterium sp.]HKR88201.1 hypothetical protein [Phenylobacterium sp.]